MIRGSCFDLHHTASGRQQARLGLIISKRFARSAVLRNLIKRQIREMFRHTSSLLPAEDIVFRLARPLIQLPEQRHEQGVWLRAEIQLLLDKMAKRATESLK